MLGAFKLNSLARAFAAAIASIRTANNIIAFGNTQVSTTQSKFGNSSIVFDGTDDYLNSTIETGSVLQGDLTIEAWLRFDILPASQTIAGGSYMMLYSCSTEPYILIQNNASNNPKIQFGFNGRYGSATLTSTTIAINTWYHFAAVRSSGSWKAYWNGVDMGTIANDSNWTALPTNFEPFESNITWGKFSDSRGSWDGNMDEIRVSKTARYTANFTPSTTPFVNDSNTLLLIHGNGTDASTRFVDDNGTRASKGLSAFGNTQIDTTQFKFGDSSALFDGTGDYIISKEFTCGSSWTIECWFRPTIVTGERHLFQVYDSAGNFVLVGGILNSGVFIYAGGTAAGGTVTANTWNHFVVYSDGSNMGIFLNGTYLTARGTVGAFNNYTVYIGGHPTGTSGLIGHIDEFRISNVQRYTANFTPSTTPFVDDANTLLLTHMEGPDGSKDFFDDNSGVALPTQKLNTALSTSHDYWRGNDMAYLGNDSLGRPVFCTGFSKVTTILPTLVLFRLNLNDLTITKGSEYTLDGTNQAAYVSVFSERDGAGLRTTSGFTDYAYATWARSTANTGTRAVAFSYSLDNLTVTLGTNIALAGTTGAQSSGHYIGNSKIAGMTNGGNNGNYLVQNFATRTAGTTTLTKNGVADNASLGGFGQGGGYNTKGMSSERWITALQTGNNGHGWNINATRTNGTALVGADYGYAVESVFNTECKIAQLDNASRFISACGGQFTSTNLIKLLAGTVTWNTGATAPTIAVGTAVTVETNANGRFGICEGKVNGEAYFIFCDNNNGLKLKYKKITVATNTITQGDYNTLLEIGNTQGYYILDATRLIQIGSDYYLVVGMRNQSTGTVDVAVVKNPA